MPEENLKRRSSNISKIFISGTKLHTFQRRVSVKDLKTGFGNSSYYRMWQNVDQKAKKFLAQKVSQKSNITEHKSKSEAGFHTLLATQPLGLCATYKQGRMGNCKVTGILEQPAPA